MASEEQALDLPGGSVEQPAAAKAPPVLKQRVPSQVPLILNTEGDSDQASAVKHNETNPHGVHVYDLFKNRSCIATLVLLSGLLAYFITDSLPLGEAYVAGYPFGLFLLAATGVATLVYAVNHFGGVPRTITAGLALTAAVVGTLAAHPALLRINALTDAGELQHVEYRRMTQNHFDPVNGEWPAINMMGRNYWLLVPGEVSRTIPIRLGGLGFYQADLTEIRFELELSDAFGQNE